VVDPASVKLLIPSTSMGNTVALDLLGHEVYTAVDGAMDSPGVYGFDVTTPQQPAPYAKIATFGLPQNVFLDDRILYVAMGADGLTFVEVTEADGGDPKGDHAVAGDVTDVSVNQGYAFLVGDSYGLEVVDVTGCIEGAPTP